VTARWSHLPALLDRWLPALVVLTAAAGLAAPAPGRFLDTHAAIPVVLAVLVLTAGTSVEAAAFRRLRDGLPAVALIVAVSTLALPALAWLAGRLVTDPALRDGVLAAGVAPAEVATLALAALASTDTALTALLLITSTVATVALAGPALSLLAGANTSVGVVALTGTLALVVALPLTLGIAARARWPHATPLRTAASTIGNLTLLALVYLVAAQIPHTIAYLPVIPALLAYLAAAAGLGWALSRLVTARRRRAVLLPVAMRDFAVAAGIADTAFGHTAAAPLGAYGILVLLFGSLVSHQRTTQR
jgi:predicted Na+-dependent transporter